MADKTYTFTFTEEEADITAFLIEQAVVAAGPREDKDPKFRAAIRARNQIRTLQGKLAEPVIGFASFEDV